MAPTRIPTGYASGARQVTPPRQDGAPETASGKPEARSRSHGEKVIAVEYRDRGTLVQRVRLLTVELSR